MELVNQIKVDIARLANKQGGLEVTDYVSEDDFEEYLHEIYEYEQTNYHMRIVDPIMFRQEYLNYCDSLEQDGWLLETDDWKELQYQIDELKDLLSDIEDCGCLVTEEEIKEFQERYDDISEEF